MSLTIRNNEMPPAVMEYMRRCEQFGEMTPREAMIYFAGQRDGTRILSEHTGKVIESVLAASQGSSAFIV